MGCLSERYLADLEREIPEVDGWYGKFNYKELLKALPKGGMLRYLPPQHHVAKHPLLWRGLGRLSDT